MPHVKSACTSVFQRFVQGPLQERIRLMSPEHMRQLPNGGADIRQHLVETCKHLIRPIADISGLYLCSSFVCILFQESHFRTKTFLRIIRTI